MLRKKLLIIALAVFGTLFSLPAAANTCPSASPQGVGCPTGSYYCFGSCRSGLSWCPTWSPTPICASGLDCSNCSSADSCGVCNACNSGYRLCGTYPNSFCKANSTLPPNCASYNANCDGCASCLAGYTLSGSSCVTAILKLGPSSVSSTNVVLGGDDSSLFVSGNKVGIGNSGPTANLHLNATTDTEGLRIVTSNYSPFVIRNAADTEDLFRIDQEGNITGVGSFGSGDSYWVLNGANLYASSTSWNVGIGTTAPGYKLHIKDQIDSGREVFFAGETNDDANSGFYVMNATIGNGEFRPAFLGYKSGDNNAPLTFNGQTTSTYDTGSEPLLRFTANRKAGDRINGTNSSIVTRPIVQFLNYNTPLMTILANGNVGIGTTTPSQKLSVVGNIIIPNNSSVLSRNVGNNVSVPLFKFNTSDALEIGT
ncbi:MAG TPA: hypothetical protein PLJ97_03015, partial [Candidatus Saccharibacteria bacterium]|nr:hypothetical protein [Candidatus Saccharibacteria bacterium]